MSVVDHRAALDDVAAIIERYLDACEGFAPKDRGVLARVAISAIGLAIVSGTFDDAGDQEAPRVDELVRCSATSDSGVRCQKRFPRRFLEDDGTGHAGGHCYATDEVWERLTNDHITGLEAAKAIAGLPFATHPAEDCNSRCAPAAVRLPGTPRRR